MTDNVYELNHVSFSYKILKPHALIETLFSKDHQKTPSKFQALTDINFSVEKGTKVGIVGRNGSGKSTLLRLMAGIYSPDSGEIVINSKSVSMLALGTGFDLAASGYENIYLNSLLRGYRKKDVDNRLQEIIEFSGIEDFINKPVKTYSTGMRMRLAFSIAVHFEPDVLLIDEALSVGDAEFQKKSAEKMNELIRNRERTVVFVSHSAPLLQKECDTVVWLESGRVRLHGDAKEVLTAYCSASQ